jgi:hypothetical protein
MRRYEFTLQPRLELPKCENCNARMWLLEIKPIGPDGDRRTFECMNARPIWQRLWKHPWTPYDQNAPLPEIFEAFLTPSKD